MIGLCCVALGLAVLDGSCDPFPLDGLGEFGERGRDAAMGARASQPSS
jgi:hypothetical protein